MAGKYALLIGNNEYDDPRLASLNASLRDIEALEGVLNRPELCGFDEVKRLENPSFRDSMRELNLLFAGKTKDDLVLFYFSGHGVKDHTGDLFFVVKESEWGLYDGTAISASHLKIIANKSGSNRQVLILDCCFSGAIAKGFKGSETCVTEDTFEVKGYGREILTATDGMQYAMDGDRSSGDISRSLFTDHLVEGLETGRAAPADSEVVTVEQLYQYVHDQVKAANPAMTPRYWRDRAEGHINLARNPRHLFSLPEDLRNDLEDPNWRTRLGALQEIKGILEDGVAGKSQAALTFLKQRAEHERDRIVHRQMESLLASFEGYAGSKPDRKDSKIPRASVINPVPESGTVFRDELKDGSNGPEMVVIPAGKFRMGDIRNSGADDEKPVHDVTIAKRFALGRYPLTFAEYDFYCETNGVEKPDNQSWGRNRRPVINVSWEDAVAYTRWLRDETGKNYRLPSEAEWEYAARTGMKTDYWWGNEASKEYANYDGSQTTPVDQFRPNPFGLNDMPGNVSEWVADCYEGSYENKPMDGSAWTFGSCTTRVLRGGSWGSAPWRVRSAYRTWFGPRSRSIYVGFRLARDL
ncbi:MAG: caspase, EACC1-associated type [Methylococcales bacterium]